MKVWGKGPPRGSDVYVTRAEGSPAPSVLQQHHGSGLACGSEALRLFPALVRGAHPLSHFPATWAGLGLASEQLDFPSVGVESNSSRCLPASNALRRNLRLKERCHGGTFASWADSWGLLSLPEIPGG